MFIIYGGKNRTPIFGGALFFVLEEFSGYR